MKELKFLYFISLYMILKCFYPEFKELPICLFVTKAYCNTTKITKINHLKDYVSNDTAI